MKIQHARTLEHRKKQPDPELATVEDMYRPSLSSNAGMHEEELKTCMGSKTIVASEENKERKPKFISLLMILILTHRRDLNWRFA